MRRRAEDEMAVQAETAIRDKAKTIAGGILSFLFKKAIEAFIQAVLEVIRSKGFKVSYSDETDMEG